MKHLITILLFITSISTFAQNRDNLIGKWKYQDVYEKEKLEVKAAKMLEMFFGEMTFYFKEDGNYKAQIMGKEELGTWKLTADKKVIELTSFKGQIVEFDIISLNEELLIIKIEKGTFIMASSEVTEEDKQIEERIVLPSVSATIDQLSKKWFAVNVENPDKTKEQNEISKNFLKDGYLKLDKNGSYQMSIMLDEDGQWLFGKENKSIILESNGKKKMWYINKITDTELILVKGIGNSKWIYSTKK